MVYVRVGICKWRVIVSNLRESPFTRSLELKDIFVFDWREFNDIKPKKGQSNDGLFLLKNNICLLSFLAQILRERKWGTGL